MNGLEADPKRVQAKVKSKLNSSDPTFRIKLDCTE